MRMTSFVLLAAVLTCSALAQQTPAAKSAGQSKTVAAPASPADTPSKEQLIRLFDAMEVQKQMASMVTAVGSNLEKMMPSSMGNLSAKQQADMAKLNTEMFAKMMTPEFIDSYLEELVPIYQRHFTKIEVDELISFYASPVGQKLLHEQPLLTQESLGKIMPLMQKRVQDVMTEMNYEQRIKEIFAEEEQTATPPKK
jgi:uncharacterized protein